MTELDYFVHQNGICESVNIGRGTRIWAFSHIFPGAKIGTDCNICENVLVENDVVVGNRVTIKSGVQLWDGVRLEDDVFVGPNATFTNDPFPRSKRYQEAVAHTVVRRGASIGANATILPGLTIGRNAMVGAAAVVTRSVPPNAIVLGNPARIAGYDLSVRTKPTKMQHITVQGHPDLEVTECGVRGVKLFKFPFFVDMRGNLSASEFDRDLPFIPRRHFVVFGVPSAEIRGEHAHKRCHQLLICVHGRVNAIVDDGRSNAEIILDHPSLALYVPPMTWGTQYLYSADAVLFVFASDPYDSEDYIREYEEFVTLCEKQPATNGL
jgi:UDP-2-acetamido-3-amino-2,3-dideoxy-glucuronate N-acetyltransferase